jgi:hypothetical protein
MKKAIFVTIILLSICFTGLSGGGDTAIASAFANHQSSLQVQGEGQVVTVLSDDNQGSRHQRFIIKLASGQTLRIAHNIDVAKRVAAIKVGDTIEFSGEYEWNPQGGAIHWTHHDPQGHHASGWIKHNGQLYQ